MSKKIIAVFTAITMMVTMIVPIMAGGGDGTADDTFGANVVMSPRWNSTGSYELGTDFKFSYELYPSNASGLQVVREISITSDKQFSDFMYQGKMNTEGSTEWLAISGFNKTITIANDIDRQFKVKFHEDGVYGVNLTFTGVNNNFALKMDTRYIVIKDGTYLISRENPEQATEVTTEEPTKPVETEVTTEEPTKPVETEVTTEEPTKPVGTEVTTEEPTKPVETEVTTEEPTKPGEAVETTVIVLPTKEEKTTAVPKTTKVKVPRAKINKATKKKSAKKAKISLKKLTNVTGYQIQISTKKQFKKKSTKTKYTKKVKYTFKKLKANKKYYVRARAYVQIKGTKTYGQWSRKVKVKFKK